MAQGRRRPIRRPPSASSMSLAAAVRHVKRPTMKGPPMLAVTMEITGRQVLQRHAVLLRRCEGTGIIIIILIIVRPLQRGECSTRCVCVFFSSQCYIIQERKKYPILYSPPPSHLWRRLYWKKLTHVFFLSISNSYSPLHGHCLQSSDEQWQPSPDAIVRQRRCVNESSSQELPISVELCEPPSFGRWIRVPHESIELRHLDLDPRKRRHSVGHRESVKRYRSSWSGRIAQSQPNSSGESTRQPEHADDA